MNKIYKSVYNAVRGVWVVVSETTSSYKQHSKSVMDSAIRCEAPNATVKAIATATMVACLMMGSGDSKADPDYTDVMGGKYIGGFMQEGSEVFIWRSGSPISNWTYSTSNLRSHPNYISDRNWNLKPEHGDWYALADGGSGSFVHDTNKTVTMSGMGSHSFLFYYLAVNGGTATITNKGSGTINFNGQEYSAIYKLGGKYKTDLSGMAVLKNTKGGTINLEGGEYASAIVWASNSTFENYGVFNILSGGIDYFADKDVGTSTINNYEYGSFNIRGENQPAIDTLFTTRTGVGDDNKAVINNSGFFIISGGKGERAHGIRIAMNNSNDGGTGGIVEINNSNEMTIQGGEGVSSYGIERLVDVSDFSSTAEGMRGVGKALITNNGTLLIQGGTGANSHGIDLMSYGVQKKGRMYSAKSPSMKSLGGDCNSESYITNNEGATLRLLGNVQKGTFGINQMTSGNGNYAYVVIQNSGVMELNKNAIHAFGPGTVTITNKSGSTVNTEAGALYSGSYGPVLDTPQAIPIYVKKASGETASVQTNAFASNITTQNGTLSLKDDWKKSASWELGTTVNFTDIIEGTALAESIRQQFEAAFGTNATLNFTATGGSGGSSEFTKAIVNTLINEGKLADGDVITSETLKLNNESFKLANAGGTFAFNETGFKGILGATDIAVQDGKRLTLMGDMVSMAMAARASDAKPTNRITDSAMTLTNGHLDLGIESKTATGGVLASISNDALSTINVNNGVYVFESLTGDGQLNVGAKGQVYLDGTDNVIANAGHFTIEKAFTLKDKGASFTKIDVPEFRNEGTVVMQDFTIEDGAEYRNVKNGTTNAKAVKLNAGSALTNLGTMTVDSLTGWGTIRNKGTLNVSGQLFVPGQSTQYLAGTVNAGDLVIGQTDKPQESSLLALNPMGILMVQGQTFAKKVSFNNGNINVTDGATFALGMSENDYKDFTKEHKDLVKDKTVLVVDKSFDFGENDSLWVGQDKSDKNLALGEKSLVVLTAENLKGQAMFDAKDGATLSADIAEGAQFVFEGSMLGRHYIAKGFDEASHKAFESLTITNLKDNQVMDVGSNANGVFVINGTDNIATIAPDALFKDAFNHVLNANQDTESKNAMVAWISKLISQKDVTNTTLTQATMSLAQTAALAGVEQQGLAHGLTMADELKADHAKDGLLWANVLHTKSDVSGLDLGNGLEADYDVKGNGLVVGAELPLSNSLALGTAVSYQKAKVEATGLQNEAETVAGSIYAKERVGAFNFMQSVTVAKTNHEVKGFNSTDVDTQALVLDLEGAYTHELSQGFAVQPYAGLRASMLKVDDSTIAMGGHDVVKHEGDTDTFIQMPVGVKLQKAMETSGGWRVMGEAKLGAVTTLGNTEANSKVSAIGFTGTDSLETQVLDRTVGDFGINVMAGNKTVQMGVGYNFQGSSSVKDHQLKANLKFVF